MKRTDILYQLREIINNSSENRMLRYNIQLYQSHEQANISKIMPNFKVMTSDDRYYHFSEFFVHVKSTVHFEQVTFVIPDFFANLPYIKCCDKIWSYSPTITSLLEFVYTVEYNLFYLLFFDNEADAVIAQALIDNLKN